MTELADQIWVDVTELIMEDIPDGVLSIDHLAITSIKEEGIEACRPLHSGESKELVTKLDVRKKNLTTMLQVMQRYLL